MSTIKGITIEQLCNDHGHTQEVQITNKKMEETIVSENDMLEGVIKDDEPRDDFDSDFD